MDEGQAGRIAGTFVADVFYYTLILGIGYISIKTASKLLKIAVTHEVMKSINKTRMQEQKVTNQIPNN